MSKNLALTPYHLTLICVATYTIETQLPSELEQFLPTSEEISEVLDAK